MEVIYYNDKCYTPKVSLVLLDWSCRESFHIFEYLKHQDVPRDQYEIIWIEYYSRIPESQKTILDNSLKDDPYPILDQWIVMGMPDEVYYHKHLMYNVGIAMSRGEIVLIGDSDAIVNPSFIRSVIEAFNDDENIVLHMDQFRNVRHDFHPFNFPQISDILGEGCVNIKDGKTTGILNTQDPLHTRNYGACMCAMKKDIISIGGADEHIDYLGHICGPYDLTFRLRNIGKKEIWHQEEFLYHVWHPGQAGEGNYLGPHDGRHMSTTALEALTSGRTMSLVENPVIQSIRKGERLSFDEKLDRIIDNTYLEKWNIKRLDSTMELQKEIIHPVSENFNGFNIFSVAGYYYAVKIGEGFSMQKIDTYIAAKALDSIKELILNKINNHEKDIEISIKNRSRFYASKIKRRLKQVFRIG